MTVHDVLELQLTEAAFVPVGPNVKVVLPGANPVPVIVMVVPPALGPLLGFTPVIVARNLNWSFAETALVPPTVVTVTSTPAGLSGGEAATIEVAVLTAKLAAATEPNLTALAALKFVPLMVTLVPPATGPILGASPVTAGAGT